MTQHKKWEILNSKYIVNDRWLKLRADACKTPEGHTKDPYYVFEQPDWITCLAIEGTDAVMIRQYRHGAQEYILEMIAGWIDATDSSPAAAARREMAEEIGYSGGAIYQTGVSYANPANQNNKIYSFLAIGGSCDIPQSLEIGESIHVERVPLSQLSSMMLSPDSGEVFQSYNLTNLLFARNFIHNSDEPALLALREYF